MKTWMRKILPGVAAVGILTVGGSVAWANVNSAATPNASQTAQGSFQPGTGPLSQGYGHRGQGAGQGAGQGLKLGQGNMQGRGEGLGLGPSGGPQAMTGVLNLLHIDAQTLMQERQSGQSLADIAKAHGVTEQALVSALTEQHTQRIQAALQAGRITQDEATAAQKTMQSRIQQAIHNQATHQGPWMGSSAPATNSGV